MVDPGCGELFRVNRPITVNLTIHRSVSAYQTTDQSRRECTGLIPLNCGKTLGIKGTQLFLGGILELRFAFTPVLRPTDGVAFLYMVELVLEALGV
jgi:hypothetical protein